MICFRFLGFKRQRYSKVKWFFWTHQAVLLSIHLSEISLCWYFISNRFLTIKYKQGRRRETKLQTTPDMVDLGAARHESCTQVKQSDEGAQIDDLYWLLVLRLLINTPNGHTWSDGTLKLPPDVQTSLVFADTWTHCGPLLSHNPSSPHGPTRGNLQTSRDLAWGVDLTITYVITHNSLQYGRDVVNLFMKG